MLLLLALFSVTLAALPEGVQLLGRFLELNGGYAADWSGSTIRLLVQATASNPSVTLKFQSDDNFNKFFVGVNVDCQDGGKVEVNKNALVFTYSLPAAQAGQVIDVSFVKITEASNGDATGRMIIEGVSASNAEILQATDPAAANHVSACSPPTQQSILFVGDSITAAYGVDGTPPCSYSASSQDVRHSYALLLASQFQLKYQVVAWSGKGVVRNYGDVNQVSVNPMPVYYNRTNAIMPDSFYNPRSFSPKVVVIMLGT
ncbi:hypothetical protein EON64_00705 [archaeon]|nr:MAG: hypothetical protein EON64_00705 [archaeon]